MYTPMQMRFSSQTSSKCRLIDPVLSRLKQICEDQAPAILQTAQNGSLDFVMLVANTFQSLQVGDRAFYEKIKELIRPQISSIDNQDMLFTLDQFLANEQRIGHPDMEMWREFHNHLYDYRFMFAQRDRVRMNSNFDLRQKIAQDTKQRALTDEVKEEDMPRKLFKLWNVDLDPVAFKFGINPATSTVLIENLISGQGIQVHGSEKKNNFIKLGLQRYMELMPEYVLVQAEPEKITKTKQTLVNGMVRPAVYDICDEHTLKYYEDDEEMINKNLGHLMQGLTSDDSLHCTDNIVTRTYRDGSEELLDMASYIAF